jgi:hypothetical protein
MNRGGRDIYIWKTRRIAIAGSRTLHVVMLTVVSLALSATVASAKVKPLPGTFRPGLLEASQIVKYSGYETRCLVIDVDGAARKWAYVTFDRTVRGCKHQAFDGFAVVHETQPANNNTVGLAWKPAYEASDPTCPLPKVPASVARVFRVCQ